MSDSEGAALRPAVVCLMGPTAAGKTDLAVELARRWPFALVSVDSALVYREMDIGTAKPDLATRQLVPHRLVDILDPAEAYSAGRFRSDALREIAAIQEAGKIPLLVGGTMLYFRTLEHGLAELPPADAAVRARLAAEWVEQGGARLHARLARLDPAAAARIHPRDPQRLQRALEVCELSGRSLTELYAGSRAESLPFRMLKLIVAPAERRVLHQRIERRFQHMLEQGFIAEVERLRARGDLLNKPSMRAVGYRQVWSYLDGGSDYARMVERSVVATRQFAKRQLTWLRAETQATWLDSAGGRLLDRTLVRFREDGFFSKVVGRLC
ncbi:MAG TPA: tRNA (adenosine(37)-N6)-dimethylallyltransferase MiaA [Candidatus Competibacter sp.]|nr:tRNA (adenosine(37)-N6)-dimethylallyltransferase MiaA [Candidatus Competibacter sp.]HUM94052.1 tRNA (adenosine(37)-N6)-dimethylallyltransferase MiaA [Candidatus Competibacter sp.]